MLELRYHPGDPHIGVRRILVHLTTPFSVGGSRIEQRTHSQLTAGANTLFLYRTMLHSLNKKEKPFASVVSEKLDRLFLVVGDRDF